MTVCAPAPVICPVASTVKAGIIKVPPDPGAISLLLKVPYVFALTPLFACEIANVLLFIEIGLVAVYAGAFKTVSVPSKAMVAISLPFALTLDNSTLVLFQL